ncbi:MAG TPA: secondary thiamine-phosphate synthase enzyme YjbQ [Methanothrix sp.]|jgi:secondary thiamine-phosphate synthase enzyme|nr:secondary thiamine-phosphate synthase enzyme YjbQ [Methanothrix sp.]HOU71383.1 secondary thiamine-phosphate synthase enzyme YjbQ [Methanothrix sp.]HQE97765.1 secondary thiamine-phosphate synthase enzyme YjbQ [Methanothrix sp.]HQJ80519.1 secondary thiamine-phosphate synthase enzyme YjbQ [Methanothrix sp.]HUM81465.1 secondary thiamine-phosphate synthase enzyme YjbQ [Methanothrix sp.]
MISTAILDFATKEGEVKDISHNVQEALQQTSLQSGLVTVFSPGSTGSVTTIEFEPGLVEDMEGALQRLAPDDIDYAHNLRWHDGNGHSHIRASLIGPSISIPFSQGKLMLGVWQQIVFLELDARPRQRRLIVQIMGE